MNSKRPLTFRENRNKIIAASGTTLAIVPYVSGRSPRTPRNSRGPLIRRRLRCARSPLVAAWSPRRSISRPAISAALRCDRLRTAALRALSAYGFLIPNLASKSQRPVHPSEQPADANGNYGGRLGLGLDSATICFGPAKPDSAVERAGPLDPNLPRRLHDHPRGYGRHYQAVRRAGLVHTQAIHRQTTRQRCRRAG